jgi:RimJ/RimL family protein N-acetyltransferase
MVELLNEPSFIRNIGDRGVRTLADARRYIADGPVASYGKFGFGLYLVELKEPRTAIGICGLLKREALRDPDMGFAFLPAFWSQGYAHESALAVKVYALHTLGLPRILAITDPGNVRSIRLLERLGFAFEQRVRMAESEPELRLFACNR